MMAGRAVGKRDAAQTARRRSSSRCWRPSGAPPQYARRLSARPRRLRRAHRRSRARSRRGQKPRHRRLPARLHGAGACTRVARAAVWPPSASSTSSSPPKASGRGPGIRVGRTEEGAIAAEDAIGGGGRPADRQRRATRTVTTSGPERMRALRLHCLIEMLYATGMRVTELVSLPRSVLDGDDRVLTIKGKGGRERLVPLNAPARAALDRYLAARHGRRGSPTPRASAPSGCFRQERAGPSDAAALRRRT